MDDEEFQALPPGYKFMPTDEEALKDYLLPKLHGRYISPRIIHEFDIYLCEPQALPGFRKGEKSFYFTPRERKHANGSFVSRCIKGRKDFWKMTSKITTIKDKNGMVLGRKSSLAYYSKGDTKEVATKTKYLMQEYVLDDSHKDFQASDKLNNMALCAVYLRESSKKEKETQAINDGLRNRSYNKGCPQKAAVPMNNSAEDGRLSALIPTEYSPEQYLSDQMESPRSVLVPTNNYMVDEQQQSGLVSDEYNPQFASIEENPIWLKDPLVANDFIGQQTVEFDGYIDGNPIWLSTQSFYEPQKSLQVQRPSTLEELIATGTDYCSDIDISTCIDYETDSQSWLNYEFKPMNHTGLIS